MEQSDINFHLENTSLPPSSAKESDRGKWYLASCIQRLQARAAHRSWGALTEEPDKLPGHVRHPSGSSWRSSRRFLAIHKMPNKHCLSKCLTAYPSTGPCNSTLKTFQWKAITAALCVARSPPLICHTISSCVQPKLICQIERTLFFDCFCDLF